MLSKINQKTFQGDSGGPMVCRDKLTGIVSFGPTHQCGVEKMPGVYTKVSSFAKVIDKLIEAKKQSLNFEDDSFNEDDEHSLLPIKFLK